LILIWLKKIFPKLIILVYTGRLFIDAGQSILNAQQIVSINYRRYTVSFIVYFIILFQNYSSIFLQEFITFNL